MKTQLIATHLNAPYGAVVTAAAVEKALRAQQRAGLPMNPLLGGGTRLMLSLEHRISHDIDLFIRDPQWLNYLTPRLNDTFETRINDYVEGPVHLKFVTGEGEIDFIVRMSLLGLPPERSEGCRFPLEPMAEVLAKKLFYRGYALAPRDLFDWNALIHSNAPDLHLNEVMPCLGKKKLEELIQALTLMPANLAAQAAWARIAAPEPRPSLDEAAQRALAWCRASPPPT